jgi:hypothetical protein
MTGLPSTAFRRFLTPFAALSVVLATHPVWADVPISDNARSHFTAGVSYLQDPDGARYEDAYREFKAAYAESPSWKILGNIGLTAMKLERDGEAIEAYREYLRQGGKEIEADERAQIQRDHDTLAAGLVSAVVDSTPAGATVTDERIPVRGDRVVNSYGAATAPLRLGLRAGHHRIVASQPGYTDDVWEFEAKPGEQLSHSFHLQAPTPQAAPTGAVPVAPLPSPNGVAPSTDSAHTSRPVPASVYVGLAATVAFAAGGSVVGVLASSKRSDFNKANDGSNPSHAQDLRDSGTKLNLVADVLFGGAVVGAAVTSVLYFTRPTQSTSSAGVRAVYPLADSHGGGLYLLTAF